MTSPHGCCERRCAVERRPMQRPAASTPTRWRRGQTARSARANAQRRNRTRPAARGVKRCWLRWPGRRRRRRRASGGGRRRSAGSCRSPPARLPLSCGSVCRGHRSSNTLYRRRPQRRPPRRRSPRRQPSMPGPPNRKMPSRRSRERGPTSHVEAPQRAPRRARRQPRLDHLAAKRLRRPPRSKRHRARTPLRHRPWREISIRASARRSTGQRPALAHRRSQK